NLDRSVEKAVQKALRAPPTGRATWASIAARGVTGPPGLLEGTRHRRAARRIPQSVPP
ncbi:hypothetical protein E4U58_003117, partial [Claviceps cyperi]